MTDSATSTVQWQSALWGIAAIALNTIVQPAGSVCGLPSSYGMWLRSSPWCCLADAINVIYAITKNVRYLSLRQAIRAVAESRHQHDAERGQSSLSQRFVRWLLMAVAIVQMVKLFAYRGLPWTLVFGAMYIISFLPVELLTWLGRPSLTEPPREPSLRAAAPAKEEMSPGDGEHLALPIVFPACPQIVLWLSNLGNFAPPLELENLSGTNLPTWCLCLAAPPACFLAIFQYSCLMVAIFLPVTFSFIAADLAILLLPSLSILYLLYLTLHKWFCKQLTTLAEIFDVEVRTMCSTIGVASAAVMIHWQVQLFGLDHAFYPAITSGLMAGVIDMAERSSPPARFLVTSRWAGAGLGLSVVAFVTMAAYQLLFVGRLATFFGLAQYHDGTRRLWARTFFLFTNLTTALLYYGLVYKSNGTCKPTWKNYLG